MKKLLPIVLLFLSTSSVFSDENDKYKEFENVDQQTEKMRLEIQEWTAKANDLVIRIDALIEKYHTLKDTAKTEVVSFKGETEQSIQKENQFLEISQTACKKGNNTECENANFHQNRINDLSQKLEILQSMEDDLNKKTEQDN